MFGEIFGLGEIIAKGELQSSPFSNYGLIEFIKPECKWKVSPDMQDNAQKSPRDMATLGRYRETNSSFWRGFFMGYFSPTSSARLVNPQHYPADPFLEDQKRIGADMYTAMGLIAETAEKIGSPTSLQQTTESSPVTKPNTRKNNTLSQLS